VSGPALVPAPAPAPIPPSSPGRDSSTAAALAPTGERPATAGSQLEGSFSLGTVLGAAPAPLGSATESGGVAFAAEPDPGSRMLRTVVFDRKGMELAVLQDQDLTIAGLGAGERGEAHQLEALQRSLRSTAFANALDRLRNDAREDVALEHTLTVSAAGVSLGLSLVYVLWLIRGGVLMGSYLSALPAWRILDPLPVLARPDDEAEEDEEDLHSAGKGGRDVLRGFE